MIRYRVVIVAAMLLTWHGELHGARLLDRAAVLAALEQRAATGVPRHLDHDDGEELQSAVTATLAANPNDPELAWAAVRASLAVVPHVGPVINDAQPVVGVELLAPFALPWKIATTGTIDISVDGSEWRTGGEIQAASSQTSIPLAKLFPRAARQGFHVVRLRASLAFTGQPGFLPSTDTRELQALTYGVTGTAPAGRRVAAFLDIAKRMNASDLDPALPQIPLDTWLRTMSAAANSAPPRWTGQWCDERGGAEDGPTGSICARSMFGLTRDGAHGELWIRIATADTSGEQPTWTAVSPTADSADLIDTSSRRSTVRLAALPAALQTDPADWPRAALALEPRSVTFSPATPKPGESVAISIELRNSGTADLPGLMIDMIVADSPDGPPLLHRRFIRSVTAGDAVTIEMPAVFPRGYGGVIVGVMSLNEHSGLAPLISEDSEGLFSHAVRLVRPELAPPGFVDRIREGVGCKPGCPNVR